MKKRKDESPFQRRSAAKTELAKMQPARGVDGTVNAAG
jgi:hypothetical protein